MAKGVCSMINLNKKNIRIQAEQFLSYFSKFDNAKLDAVFSSWVESKDFDKATEKAIRSQVNRIIKRR